MSSVGTGLTCVAAGPALALSPVTEPDPDHLPGQPQLPPHPGHLLRARGLLLGRLIVSISHIISATDLTEELLQLPPGGRGDHCPLPPLSALLQLRGRGRAWGRGGGSAGIVGKDLIHFQPLLDIS